jgi:PAS domain S-box-containing protein
MQTNTKHLVMKLTLIYVVVAACWVAFSDELVVRFISNPDVRVQVSMVKGWGFVLFTGVLLHQLLRRLLKQAEIARQESEERYRRLFEVETDAVFLADRSSLQIIDANPAAEMMYGYTRDELLRLKATDLSAEPEKTGHEIANGKSRIRLRMHRRKDGTIFPVEISVNDFDFQGRRLHVAAMRDITARKQSEKAVQESEERYRHLFEMESDAVVLVDTETHRYLDVNLAAQTLYGYTKEEFLKMTPEDVSDEPEKTRDHINAGDEHVPLRWHRKKNGERFAVEINASRIIYKGRRTALVALRDVTERQRSDEALKNQLALHQQLTNIVQTVPGVIYSFRLRPDGSTCFPYASPAIRELFGFDPVELAKDASSIFALIHPDDVSRVQADIAESAHTLKTWCGEFRFNHPTRGEIWVSGRAEPQAQPDGSILWQGFTTEDTERKQMEHLLAHERDLLQALMDNLPDHIYFKDADSRFTRINRAMARHLDLKNPEEAIGKSDADFFQANEARRKLAEERQMLATGTPIIGLVEKSDTASHPKWVSSTKVPIYDVNGRNIGLVGISRDITEHKQAEETLRESQSLYHSLVSQLPVGIFRKDAMGRYVLVNPGFCKLKNVRPEDFLGKTPAEVRRAEAPSEHSSGLTVNFATTGEQHHQLIMQNGQPIELEEKRLMPDGSMQFMHVIKLPVMSAEGKIIGSQGIMVDITERKLAEEKIARLATAVEQAAEVIFITDLTGTIQYVNPAFEKVTGYTNAEAVGKKPDLLKSGRQDAAFYRRMWDTIKRGEIWTGHFINRRKDGTLFEEEATISPIRDADGKIVNYVAVNRDVTHEVRLEAQFRQAQKMEAIGTLAGGIAHDFNNILAAICGYGYLMQINVAGNPDQEENIAEILRAANRAKDLVQQILTFSRQGDQRREVIRLCTVVKEATKFLRASLPANIQISMNLAPDAPAVLANPTQIYQVTMNLATNALHAMEGWNGKLTVNLESCVPDELLLQKHPHLRPIQYARLTIADTGQGMDARTLERIYEPFFTTKAAGKGTGLGLAVVHGIVLAHDGIITVESTVGIGTTFQIYFPAKASDAAASVAVAGEAPQGNGQGILLVDDEPALTGMFQRVLQRLNYQVTISNSPLEAVGIFRANPAQFDVVITDLTMPELNGLELARQLRAIRPDLRVILASGYIAAIDDEDLRAAGICELLAKPVSLNNLAEVLQRTLKGSPPAVQESGTTTN